MAIMYWKMLTVVLLLIPLTALAKDTTKAPNGARVSKSAPTIEGNETNKSAEAQQAPVPLPLPVRIVEEPPESDDAEYRAARASR